jgi:hypothetical protein
VSAVIRELPARAESTLVPDRYLSRAELAEHLGVCVKTVDRMRREGCPSRTYGRRLRRFRLSEVEGWLRGREGRTMGATHKRPGSAKDAPGPAPRMEVVMQAQRIGDGDHGLAPSWSKERS